MEPSNRTRRSWRFWRRNPRAVEDDNAQEALIEPDLAEAYPSSPTEQPGCVEVDPAEAYPSSPPPQAQPDCVELDPADAYPSSPAEQAPPDCVEVDSAEAYPSSPPQQAQPDCFELDPAGAPLPSPPPSSTQPDPTGAPPPSPPPSPPSTILHPPPVLVDQSRLKSLSLLDCDEELPYASDSSGGHGADNNDARKSGEGAVVRQHSSNDDSDDDEDPFLTDRFGNLTTVRLSDMEAAFEKHLEDEASKPKVERKKYSKEEILKQNDDRKKKFMEYALHKYNNEEDLAGEMRFVFDEIKKEVYVVEGGRDFYEHFNFTAKQAGSPVLFFAEVVPNGDTCDVLCCKLLDCNDNGHCFGCKNQGAANLRHPADEALYVGGHEDCEFPFMWDSISDSEGDSD